ncbi:hypothetical protein Moror_2488 [Moniliophthora roreri MCA 2997]|uniref:Uncharacterized protein n=1 Tax=Moniliophthora roreri (strain MCA 2997) TaxID=1381753 RepID=V2WVX8_MONRO|nr:hypothetical protein Moror_2488 [Moniliophthora roreri MCA 2997]
MQVNVWMYLRSDEAQRPWQASAVYLPTNEPFSTPIHSPIPMMQEATSRTSPMPVEELRDSQTSPLQQPRPQCLPTMNFSPPLPTPNNSPPPLSQLIPTPNVPIMLVWDNEDTEPDDRVLQTASRSRSPTTHTTALLDEVHQALSVLCAEWESTAPSTAWTISAQFATLIKLAISLDIVGTEEGLRELRDEMIPAAH